MSSARTEEGDIKIVEGKRISLSLALAAIIIGSLASAVAAGTLAWSSVRSQAASVEPLAAKVDVHDKALSELKMDMAVVKNDVGWVRRYLAGEAPVRGVTQPTAKPKPDEP